jgi:hypothetical protein
MPFLSELASSKKALCSRSPAFVALAQETITKLEAIEELTKDPLNIAFKVCGPSCDVCKQLHAFCTVSTVTSTEITKAGAGSKNRKHLTSMLEPCSKLVAIKTRTNR